jgi:hypothetical protein
VGFFMSKMQQLGGASVAKIICFQFSAKLLTRDGTTACVKCVILFVCLLSRVPQGRTTVLLLKSVPLPHCILVQNVHVIIIPAGTIARSSRFGPESMRGPIIATRHPASQARGKRSPHDLPDLLSGRGLTYEGPCLKNVKMQI